MLSNEIKSVCCLNRYVPLIRVSDVFLVVGPLPVPSEDGAGRGSAQLVVRIPQLRVGHPVHTAPVQQYNILI